jgi:hypothetical protein
MICARIDEQHVAGERVEPLAKYRRVGHFRRIRVAATARAGDRLSTIEIPMPRAEAVAPDRPKWR